MRNLIITAIASAALGCAAGYALAPDGGSDASTAVVADGGPGSRQAAADRRRGAAGMEHGGSGFGRHGHGGGAGMRGGRGGHGYGGGGPNAQRGGPGGRHGGPPGAFAGRGPGGRGQHGSGAAGPGRSRPPATGFDLADLERSLAHMSIELALADMQQQAIRDVMQEYRRRMRELREAILAELTTEQREKLRAVEAAGSPGGSAEQGNGGNRPER